MHTSQDGNNFKGNKRPPLPHKCPPTIFPHPREQHMADSHGTYTHTSESRGEETPGSSSQAEDGGSFLAIISPPPGDKAGLGPRWGQRQQLQQPTLCFASSQMRVWGLPEPYSSMVQLWKALRVSLDLQVVHPIISSSLF